MGTFPQILAHYTPAGQGTSKSTDGSTHKAPLRGALKGNQDWLLKKKKSSHEENWNCANIKKNLQQRVRLHLGTISKKPDSKCVCLALTEQLIGTLGTFKSAYDSDHNVRLH